MTYSNYLAPAELYLGRDWETAAALGPRAFKFAANALRFAFEEAAPISLRGARLYDGKQMFAGTDLLELYRSETYPLPRKPIALPRHPRRKKGSPMDRFDYDAPAELYPSRRYAKSPVDQYKRFKTAAAALHYIMEDVPGTWLAGTFLEVDERRYDGAAIRALYEAAAYPLPRPSIAA